MIVSSPGLVDVPLVEPVLLDRQPGVERRQVRGRRRRELRGDRLDLQPPQERMVGVALDELPAERVEQHDRDPLVLARQRGDSAGKFSESCHFCRGRAQKYGKLARNHGRLRRGSDEESMGRAGAGVRAAALHGVSRRRAGAEGPDLFGHRRLPPRRHGRGDPTRGRRTDPGQAAGGRHRQRLPHLQWAGPAPACRGCRTRGNPAIFTAANLAQYDAIFFWQASSRNRDDTTGQRLFTDAEQAVIESFARAGGGLAAMHASVTMAAGAGDVAVVGRAGRQRDRRADAGPLGDRRQQHRDRPGLRPQPPVDQGPARQLPLRRRALHVLLQRPRHAPRADDARRGDLQRRQRRHADGRRPPDRVVPDVRGRPRLGLEPRALLRRLPRERRRQQPASSTSSAASAGPRGRRARTPTAAARCGRTSRAPCSPTTCAARSASTSRATARSTGPRSATRRCSPRAGCGCTTRRRARPARC